MFFFNTHNSIYYGLLIIFHVLCLSFSFVTFLLLSFFIASLILLFSWRLCLCKCIIICIIKKNVSYNTKPFRLHRKEKHRTESGLNTLL